MKGSNRFRIAGLGTAVSLLGGWLLRKRRRGRALSSGLIGLALARIVVGLLGRARMKA